MPSWAPYRSHRGEGGDIAKVPSRRAPSTICSAADGKQRRARFRRRLATQSSGRTMPTEVRLGIGSRYTLRSPVASAASELKSALGEDPVGQSIG
jgi:hypothetical protein